MKLRLNPTQIVLHDLPPDGREFIFTRESGELNEHLEDLIGSNPYSVKIKITPMGNTFDVRGELETKMDLQCSLCAIDFKHAIKQQVHELIVIEKPMGKKEHQVRANHAHELAHGGPDYIQLPNDVFDVGAYVHEAIGLAEPIRPLGKPDCDVKCENLSEKPQRSWLSFGQEQAEQAVRAKPFQVLEKMKLKS
jgi:uncharacterized metal-binding protein YceD (DUF177 family)